MVIYEASENGGVDDGGFFGWLRFIFIK